MVKNVYDEYGKLIEKKKALEAEIEVLRAQIFEKPLEGGTRLKGQDFIIEVVKRVTTELSAKKVFKLVPQARFEEIFKVKLSEARKWLTPEQIDKCVTDTIVNISLQARRIEDADKS